MVAYRRHKRFDVRVPVELGSGGRYLSARTQSLSAGGLFVPTDNPFAEDRPVWISLNLPSGDFEGEGKVCYVLDNKRQLRGRGMGIRFDHFDQPSKANLADYLSELERSQQGSVLIVDDDVASTTLFQQALRQHGYRVLVVHDIFAALDILRYGEVDIVIAEAQMKRMDGFDLAQTIRQARAPLEVILITRAELTVEQRRLAKRLGVSAVIEKPVQLELLTHAVDSANLSRAGTIPQPESEGTTPGSERTPAMIPEPVTDDLTLHRLRELGVVTRRAANGAILGQLTFVHQRIHMPFDARKAVPRIRMGTVGLDRIQLYVPRPFSSLPRIPIMGLGDQRALEQAVADACQAREQACLDQRRWLDGLGVANRLDASRFVCLGHLLLGRVTVAFTVVNRTRILLDAVRGWSVRDMLETSQRIINLPEDADARELARRLQQAVKKSATRMSD